jgi:hypothetical protein
MKWEGVLKEELSTLFLHTKALEERVLAHGTMDRAIDRCSMIGFEMMKFRLEYDLVNFCNRHGHRAEGMQAFGHEQAEMIVSRLSVRITEQKPLMWGDHHPNFFVHDSKEIEEALVENAHSRQHSDLMTCISSGVELMELLADAGGEESEWSRGRWMEAYVNGEYAIQWHAGRLLLINKLLSEVAHGDLWGVMCRVARGDCSLLSMLFANKTAFTHFLCSGGQVVAGVDGISSDMLAFAVQISNSFVTSKMVLKGFYSLMFTASRALKTPCVCDVQLKEITLDSMNNVSWLATKKLAVWEEDGWRSEANECGVWATLSV